MSRSVLYIDRIGTSVVLDLPTSIEESQNNQKAQILSTLPPQVPYLTPEPKGSKRDKFLARIPAAERDFHHSACCEIQTALEHLTTKVPKVRWCLPRWSEGVTELDTASEDTTALSWPHPGPPLILSSLENYFRSYVQLRETIVVNANDEVTILRVDGLSSFLIPSRSTFLWASIEDGEKDFTNAMTLLTTATSRNFNSSGKFDLILLDPPWTNRSVRNSKAYATVEAQQQDPFEQVVPIVDKYLIEGGYVAVWVTNKAAVKAQVQVVFSTLGFVLLEEWIWVKITSQGEPVSPLDGVWRKPYEMLLILRRNGTSTSHVRRRLFFAVPDVHSRKPNLKLFLEELLPKEYLALELFARSLTAGWWSWGDEVLKFQDSRYWRERIDI